MHKDDEVKGIGNSLDFGDRWLDTRTGRLGMSRDKLYHNFPDELPYGFAGNNPILYVDVDGKFKFNKQTLALLQQKYPTAYMYLTQTDPSSIGNVLEVVASDRVVNAMIKNTMHANGNVDYSSSKYRLTKGKIQEAFTFGSAPEIQISSSPGGYGKGDEAFERLAHGFNRGDDGTDYSTPIQLNERMFQSLENAKTDLTH